MDKGGNPLPFYLFLLIFLVLVGGPSFFKYLPETAVSVLGASIKKSTTVVTRVIDGDTVQLSDGRTLRLLGIDTPEKNHPTKKVECFAYAASDKMSEILLNQEVTVLADESQSTKDKYGRYLVYIYRNSDNLFINKEMILQGFAYEYTYDKPYKYQQEFKDAQKTASEQNLGLWSVDTCNGKR